MSEPLRIAFIVKALKYQDREHYPSCYPEVHAQTKYDCATVPGTFFLTRSSTIPEVGDLVILEQTRELAYDGYQGWRLWRLVEE